MNAAKVEVHAYSKDGVGRTRNVCDPVYWPNSKGGATADASLTAEPLWHLDGDMIRAAYTRRRDDDWGQAGTMVRNVLDDAARDRLVSNIASPWTPGQAAAWRQDAMTLTGTIATARREHHSHQLSSRWNVRGPP